MVYSDWDASSSEWTGKGKGKDHGKGGGKFGKDHGKDGGKFGKDHGKDGGKFGKDHGKDYMKGGKDDSKGGKSYKEGSGKSDINKGKSGKGDKGFGKGDTRKPRHHGYKLPVPFDNWHKYEGEYDHAIQYCKETGKMEFKEGMEEICELTGSFDNYDDGGFLLKCKMCRNAKKKYIWFDEEHNNSEQHAKAGKGRQDAKNMLSEVQRLIREGELKAHEPIPSMPYILLVRKQDDMYRHCNVCYMRCVLCGENDSNNHDEEVTMAVLAQRKFNCWEHLHNQKHMKKTWYYTEEKLDPESARQLNMYEKRVLDNVKNDPDFYEGICDLTLEEIENFQRERELRKNENEKEMKELREIEENEAKKSPRKKSNIHKDHTTVPAVFQRRVDNTKTIDFTSDSDSTDSLSDSSPILRRDESPLMVKGNSNSPIVTEKRQDLYGMPILSDEEPFSEVKDLLDASQSLTGTGFDLLSMKSSTIKGGQNNGQNQNMNAVSNQAMDPHTYGSSIQNLNPHMANAMANNPMTNAMAKRQVSFGEVAHQSYEPSSMQEFVNPHQAMMPFETAYQPCVVQQAVQKPPLHDDRHQVPPEKTIESQQPSRIITAEEFLAMDMFNGKDMKNGKFGFPESVYTEIGKDGNRGSYTGSYTDKGSYDGTMKHQMIEEMKKEMEAKMREELQAEIKQQMEQMEQKEAFLREEEKRIREARRQEEEKKQEDEKKRIQEGERLEREMGLLQGRLEQQRREQWSLDQERRFGFVPENQQRLAAIKAEQEKQKTGAMKAQEEVTRAEGKRDSSEKEEKSLLQEEKKQRQIQKEIEKRAKAQQEKLDGGYPTGNAGYPADYAPPRATSSLTPSPTSNGYAHTAAHHATSSLTPSSTSAGYAHPNPGYTAAHHATSGYAAAGYAYSGYNPAAGYAGYGACGYVPQPAVGGYVGQAATPGVTPQAAVGGYVGQGGTPGSHSAGASPGAAAGHYRNDYGYWPGYGGANDWYYGYGHNMSHNGTT